MRFLVQLKLVVFLTLCFSSLYADVEMFIRNVGQGNSIAVKSVNKAIIVDSGYHQSGGYCGLSKQPHFTDPMLNFLKNCEVTVFITHTHYDHFSFLNYLFSNRVYHGIKINKIYCSDFAPPKSYTDAVLGWETMLGIKVDSVSSDADVLGINDVLGGNVRVDAVIPESWPMHGKGFKATRSKDQNDNSMAIVVTDTDNGKKILLTGDATGATLDCAIKSPANIEKMKDIDCIIVPHHGSNLSGAFSWVSFAKDNVTLGKLHPLLAIISSDPGECDCLPWFSISQINCFRGALPGGYNVAAHDISVSGVPITGSTVPAFVTKDAAMTGFFTVVSSNNALKLFNGTPSLPTALFLSNVENILTPEDRVSSLLLQMNPDALTALEEINPSVLSDKLLLELDCRSNIIEIKDALIPILQEKLKQPFASISEVALIVAMKYPETQTTLLGLLSANIANVPDGVLHKLSTYDSAVGLVDLTKSIITEKLKDPAKHSDVLLTTAMKYPDFRDFINQKLLTATVSESVWIMAIHHGHINQDTAKKLLENAADVSDGILYKLSTYGSVVSLVDLTKSIITKKLKDPAKHSDVLLTIAMKYPDFNTDFNNILADAKTYQISDTVLHEAMKYHIFNDAVYKRLSANSPIELDDMSFYIMHLKELGNLELLHRIIELPIE